MRLSTYQRGSRQRRSDWLITAVGRSAIRRKRRGTTAPNAIPTTTLRSTPPSAGAQTRPGACGGEDGTPVDQQRGCIIQQTLASENHQRPRCGRRKARRTAVAADARRSLTRVPPPTTRRPDPRSLAPQAPPQNASYTARDRDDHRIAVVGFDGGCLLSASSWLALRTTTRPPTCREKQSTTTRPIGR